MNDRRHRLQSTKEAYNSLSFELKEIKDFLDKPRKKIVEVSGDEVKTYGFYLGTSRYDSIIYSGMFRQLDHDVQNLCVDMFGRIKIINRSTDRITEILTDRASTNEDFLVMIERFGDSIETHVTLVKNKIPQLIEKIENNIPRAIL